MTTPLHSAARAVLPLLYSIYWDGDGPRFEMIMCRGCSMAARQIVAIEHGSDCPVARLERETQ